MSWPAGLALSAIAAVVVAWAARRLLGAQRVSAARTLIAAVVGITVGWVIGVLVSRGDVPVGEAAVTGAILAVLVTMFVIVGFELAARPRRAGDTGRERRNPLRAARDRWSDTRRLTEIARIARGHGLFTAATRGMGDGADEAAEEELGRALRRTLEDAGGVYVKLGQLLSTRPDVLPAPVLAELARLQGEVAPAPRDAVEAHLTARYGRPVDEVFAEFDWSPLGAASIGQVYRARLHDGLAVVVKVRRPDVVETVERDLGVLVRMADLIERRTTWGRTSGVRTFADGFASDLRSELDFTRERERTQRVAAAFADEPHLHVPDVHPELSSDTVLVMELVDGPDVGRLRRAGEVPANGADLASALLRAELSAMVRGEEFHADPHPGNAILMADGRLALIDFGSTGHLDAFERGAVTDILTALQLRDPTVLREALTQVATIPDDVAPEVLERALARLLADRLAPGMEPTPELIVDFLSIVQRFRIRLPATLTLVFRALGTMLGTLEGLDPRFSIIDAAREVAGDQVDDELTPARLEEKLREETLTLIPLLRRAPRHMDRIAGQLERGEMTVRVRAFSHGEDVRVLTELVNRAILGIVGAALGLVSVLMFRTEGGPSVSTDLSLYQLFGLIGLVAGAVLLMRVVLEILQSEP